MSVITYIIAVSHVALAGIYDCLPVLPVLYFFRPQQAPEEVLRVTHIFIPDSL